MHPTDEPDPPDTPHGRVAFAFAGALAEGRFEDAHRLLAPALRNEFPPERLRAEYEAMIAYAGPTRARDVGPVATMTSWPGKEDADLGWAYVSISGPDPGTGGDWCEAVAVVVTAVNGLPLIRQIVWGRP